MNKKIEIGLIGYGNWAKDAYVPSIMECADVLIKAVAAPSKTTRQLAQQKFPEATVFDNYNSLLDTSAVDAVMIGVPSNLVSNVAISAIQADKHIWIEPPAPGDQQVTSMLELAEKSTRVFHTDLELRYTPALTAIKNLLESKCLGNLLSIKISLKSNWATTWANDAPELGKIVSGLSIWYLDVADFLIEQSANRVDVFGVDHEHGNGISIGIGLLQYKDAIAQWAFDLRHQEELGLTLEILSTNGEITADLVTGKYRYRFELENWINLQAQPSRPILGFAGIRESSLTFIDAIKGNVQTKTGPDVLRRLHSTITAFDHSIQRNDSSKINLQIQ